MPFCQYFCYFGWILAPILAPFWHHFPYFLHAFFLHRFCIDFKSNFDDFLSAQNHVFYCKTNSFEHFSLFQKSMNFHRFWHQFWHHFGSLLALIFDTFSISNFACLFSCLFGDFWSKMAPKMAPKIDARGGGDPETAQGPFQKRFKNATSTFLRFWPPFW